jgi:uncharacterized protein YjbI with pentapeptide repeats
MKKVVILKFLGDFASGFQVTVDICNEGQPPYQTVTGRLPENTTITDCFQSWSKIYQTKCDSWRIIAKSSKNINIDSLNQDLFNKSNDLSQSLNAPIINCLNKFNKHSEIRVLISSNCQELRKLPWHLWDLLAKYSQAEIAISLPDTELGDRIYREKARILIVLGDSTNIDVETDKRLLERYCSNGEIVLLKEPSREELISHLRDELGWDILFFSGHSQTEGTYGRIFINKNDNLNMAELRDALQIAIKKRLQIAFFNSCDGLGIANELEKLNIPQVIVMREPVPDYIAQEFLKYFLQEFTGGKSLYLSVKKARSELRKLENKFPCASWLPVIVQHQLETPPTWQSLGIISLCPYQGLAAFREKNAEFFFGRETFVQQLVDDVRCKPLVAVIGASGSGKSSVVFAGLIPQLRQDKNTQWRIISFRPGKNMNEFLAAALLEDASAKPENQVYKRLQELELTIDLQNNISTLQKILENILQQQKLTPPAISFSLPGKKIDYQDKVVSPISYSLHSTTNRLISSQPSVSVSEMEWTGASDLPLLVAPPQRLLLVIDQFEEIFTLCPDPLERNIFIDGLLKAVNDVPGFTLVITLRADFLGKAMSYQPLAKALQDYPPSLLAPMNRQELERAIKMPAAKFSVELESGLVNKLIDDVGNGEGSLPLQQFALTQLWQQQRPGKLTHEAYRKIGGVKEAIANHAEEVYARLSEEQRVRMQQVFIQLVQPGEGTEDTRRLATHQEIGEENWNLVTLLASERLVITNGNEFAGMQTVEIVHEALIRYWLRLRRWIDQNRDTLRQKYKIEMAAKEWLDKGKSYDYLLQGERLLDAENWQKQNVILLPLSSLAEEFVWVSIKEWRKNRVKYLSSAVSFILIVFILQFAVLLGGFFQERNLQQLLQNYKQGDITNPRIIKDLEELVSANIDLNGLSLENANLTGINFQNAKIINSTLKKANLSKANLLKAEFIFTNIDTDKEPEGINFNEAYLNETNLSKAKLMNSNFTKAYLNNTNFSNANLSNSNFNKAFFNNTNLNGANLKGAQNLTSEQVKSAKNWEKAKYDKDFREKLGLPPEQHDLLKTGK